MSVQLVLGIRTTRHVLYGTARREGASCLFYRRWGYISFAYSNRG
jgi:hypothetical protein